MKKELQERLKAFRRWTDTHKRSYQVIVCAAVALSIGIYTFAFSDSNLGRQIRYSQRINLLSKEYKELKEAYQADSIKIENYQRDLPYLERMAREEYSMQRPEEVIFL